MGITRAAGYAGVAAAVAVEGPLATVAAGGLVGAAVLALVPVLVVVVAADLAADAVYFTLGRSLGHPRVRRLLARLGVTDERCRAVADRVGRRFPLAIAGIKVADAAAVPVLVAAGAARVGYGRFLGWDLVATVPRAALLLGLGALAGPALLDLVHRLGPAGGAAVALVPLLAVLAAVLLAAAVRALARTLAYPSRRSSGDAA
jgi:membrane protein DedA with SNARE-associated domain